MTNHALLRKTRCDASWNSDFLRSTFRFTRLISDARAYLLGIDNKRADIPKELARLLDAGYRSARAGSAFVPGLRMMARC